MNSQKKVDTQTHGVKTIWMIDSYMAGHVTGMSLDGHVAITGRNGTGKTSLLRLLPLFFGAAPGTLVRSQGSDRKSFVDYYLPRTGSAIVFEYITEAGPQMAVFTREASASYTRQLLISGGYDRGLFVTSESEFRPAGELSRAARAAGRETHRTNGLADYIDIVFGRAMKARQGTRRFNVLAGLENNQRVSMTGAHKILTDTLTNSVSENQIRNILLDQALQQLDSDADSYASPELDINTIETWIKNYQGLMDLRRHRPAADTAVKATEELARVADQYAALIQAIGQRHNHLRDRLSSLKERDRELGRERNAEVAQYEATKAKLSKEKDERSSVAVTAGQNCNALERRLQEFKNIDHQKRLAGDLGARRQALQDARDRLGLLTAGQESLRTEFNDRKEEARQRHYDELDNANAKARQVETDIAERTQEAEARQKVEIDKLEDRHEDAGEREQQRLTAAASKKAEIETQIKTADADPDLRQALSYREDERDAREREREKANQAFQEASSQYDKTDKEWRTEQETVESLGKLTEGLAKEQRELEIALERAGTLLGYLKTDQPDAIGPISAVLSQGTSLLYRSDLTPGPAGDHGASFYGVHLAHEGLPPVDVEAEDRERLDQIKSELSTASEQLGVATTREGRLRGERAARDETVAEARTKRRSAKDRYDRAREARESAQKAVEQSRAQRQTEFAKALNEAELAHQTAQQALSDGKLARKAEKTAMREDHGAETQALNKELEQAHVSARTNREWLKTQHNTHLSQLENDYQRRLADEGVDEAKLNSTRKTVAAAETRVSESRAAEAEVEKYNSVLAEYERDYPAHKQALHEAEADVARIKGELTEAERAHRAEIERLDRTIGEVRQSIGVHQDDYSICDELLSKSSPVDIECHPDESDVESWRDAAIRSVRTEEDRLRSAATEKSRQAHRTIGQIKQAFTASKSPSVAEHAREQGFAVTADLDSAEQMIQDAHFIREFFGPSPEADSQAAGHGNYPLNTYGERLEKTIRDMAFGSNAGRAVEKHERLDKAMRGLGRAVSGHCAAVVSHFDSIQQVELHLSLAAEEIPGLAEIKDLNAAYQKHKNERDRGASTLRLMPPAELSAAAARVVQAFRTRPSADRTVLANAVHLSFTIQEHARKPALRTRKGASLRSHFSEGISTLVIAIVLIGLLETSRQQMPVRVPWVLDELLRLDERNARGMLRALAEMGISMVSTSPDVSSSLDTEFERRYTLIDPRGAGYSNVVLTEVAPDLGDDALDPFGNTDRNDAMEARHASQ